MATAGNNNHARTSEAEKDAAWHKAWQHPFFKGAEAWIAAHESDLWKAFGGEGGVLMCIDEGLAPLPGTHAVHLAGSGILYDHAQTSDTAVRMQKLVVELKGKGITGVCSHTDCGACALYCKEQENGDPEETAKQWAEQLADALGVPYRGHVLPSRRPSFHAALAAYYDATGRFADPVDAGLPPGFIISRRIISNTEQAQYELELSVNIAMGDHGFGKRFTKEYPFHLVAVVDPHEKEFTEQKILAEMQTITEKYDNVRVVVLRKG